MSALLYRMKLGCSKQYYFENADNLDRWASRPAFRGEMVMVIPFKEDDRFFEKKVMPISEAASYLRSVVGY